MARRCSPRVVDDLTVPLAVDHLEQVAVHRLAKEQPLEMRRAQRLDELPARLGDAPAKRIEVFARMEQRDVAPELRLER